MNNTLEQEIVACGADVAPRVTPADAVANIICEHYFTGSQAVSLTAGIIPHKSLDLLTICVLVLRNGFTCLGKSACASPENFNVEIGRKIAKENAMNDVYSVMGYALKERLNKQEATTHD